MVQLLILGLMLSCAVVPFLLLTGLIRAGRSGLALTIASVIGATLVIFVYASGRPFGIDPVFAMTAALLVCVPAFLGSLAGAMLGWLLRKRDDRKA
jgi:hypothetical protein